MSTYPNREHQKADEAAKRRALKALDDIEAEAKLLRRVISDNRRVDGDDSRAIAGIVRDLTVHLSILGALYEVREWDAADKATTT